MKAHFATAASTQETYVRLKRCYLLRRWVTHGVTMLGDHPVHRSRACGVLPMDGQLFRRGGRCRYGLCCFIYSYVFQDTRQKTTDVTQILNAIEYGDPPAAEELPPLNYDELRGGR